MRGSSGGLQARPSLPPGRCVCYLGAFTCRLQTTPCLGKYGPPDHEDYLVSSLPSRPGELTPIPLVPTPTILSRHPYETNRHSVGVSSLRASRATLGPTPKLPTCSQTGNTLDFPRALGRHSWYDGYGNSLRPFGPSAMTGSIAKRRSILRWALSTPGFDSNLNLEPSASVLATPPSLTSSRQPSSRNTILIGEHGLTESSRSEQTTPIDKQTDHEPVVSVSKLATPPALSPTLPTITENPPKSPTSPPTHLHTF
jgi:hypothetical protein